MDADETIRKLATEADALRWLLGAILALNPTIAETIRASVESAQPPEGHAAEVQSRVLAILNSALDATAYKGSAS